MAIKGDASGTTTINFTRYTHIVIASSFLVAMAMCAAAMPGCPTVGFCHRLRDSEAELKLRKASASTSE